MDYKTIQNKHMVCDAIHFKFEETKSNKQYGLIIFILTQKLILLMMEIT